MLIDSFNYLKRPYFTYHLCGYMIIILLILTNKKTCTTYVCNTGFVRLIEQITYPIVSAFKYSRFIRAIFSNLIPLGHSIMQAPVLVQLPNPSISI